MIEKKNTKDRYNLPEKVHFCKKCVISNQRPRITFDEKGIWISEMNKYSHNLAHITRIS